MNICLVFLQVSYNFISRLLTFILPMPAEDSIWSYYLSIINKMCVIIEKYGLKSQLSALIYCNSDAYNNTSSLRPSRTHEINLHVSVAPTITTVGNQHIREALGRNASIKCLVDAFPEAVRYWKKDNTQLIETDNRYSISIREDPNSKYKVYCHFSLVFLWTVDLVC